MTDMATEQEHMLQRVILQEAFLTGIDSVDEEHRFLVGIFNNFVDSISAGKGGEVIGEVMAELIAYADYHFSNEEQMMAKVQYPDMAAHKAQHDNFISAIAKIEERRSHGGVHVAEIAQFIGRWVQGHILMTDKKLGEYVASHVPRSHAEP